MRKFKNCLLAAAIAPLAAPLLFSGGFFFAVLILEPHRSLNDTIEKITHLIPLEIAISYLAMIIFGLPYLFILQRYQQLTPLRLALGGILGGILTYACMIVLLSDQTYRLSSLGLGMVKEILIAGVLGLSVASVLNFMLRRNR